MDGGRRGGAAAAGATAADLPPAGVEPAPVPIRRSTSTPAHVGAWGGPFSAALMGGDEGGGATIAPSAVLTGRVPSELSELNSALAALGTPLAGVPVEVASQLKQQLSLQEEVAEELRKQCAGHAAAVAAMESRLAHEQRQREALEAQLEELRSAASGLIPQQRSLTASAAEGDRADGGRADGGGGEGGGAAAAKVQLSLSVATPQGEAAEAALLAPLQAEINELEGASIAHRHEQQTLLDGVRVAMSCLPPPGPLRAAAAGSGSVSSASEGPAAAVQSARMGVDGDDDVERMSAELCSSARQAAHANARLGHAMAAEREQHKTAAALAARRLSYLSADVNARVLFMAQPAKHAPTSSGVAFGALLLPADRSGLPTHWLSRESIDSL